MSPHEMIFEKYGYLFKSSHHRCSIKKGVLRNFTKFTGKHLRPSLFFNKVAGLRQLVNRIMDALFTECYFCFFSCLVDCILGKFWSWDDGIISKYIYIYINIYSRKKKNYFSSWFSIPVLCRVFDHNPNNDIWGRIH